MQLGHEPTERCKLSLFSCIVRSAMALHVPCADRTSDSTTTYNVAEHTIRFAPVNEILDWFLYGNEIALCFIWIKNSHGMFGF